MCLNKPGQKMKADRDITCYKSVVRVPDAHILKKLSGKSFIGHIFFTEVSGHISVCDERVYLCTDNDIIDGKRCEDKKGHLYSWILDWNVKSVTVAGKRIPMGYITPYFYMPIKIGRTYKSKLVFSGVVFESVEDGLHTFAEIPNDDDSVIFECVIPKGASYYEGDFCGRKAYASDKLKTVKIVRQ